MKRKQKNQEIEVIPVQREVRLYLTEEDEKGLRAGQIIPKPGILSKKSVGIMLLVPEKIL